MKTLTRTIIVLVTINLITANMAITQGSSAGQEDVTQIVVAQTEGEAQQMRKEAERRRMEAELKRIQDELTKLVSEQKGADIAESRVDMVLPQMTGRNVGIGTSRVRIPSLRGNSSEAVLVIPTSEMELENLASITEDMTIMSRIFNKKIGQSIESRFLGVYGDMMYNPFEGFGRGRGTIKTIYLEGYGALFLMKVDFPLVQPPVEQEEEETEEKDIDPVWTQTTQEIYAPQEVNRRRRIDRSDEEEYDAEKVEELKETLIKTLKHAANIRALKTDESVILTIVGKTIQSDTIVTRVYDTVGDALITTVPEGIQTDISSPTILTIRAKKSDIDAFAKGELSFDQFSQQTQVLTYSLLGESTRGMPSPSSSPAPRVERRSRTRISTRRSSSDRRR